MAGRKPLPVAVKKLKGTLQRCRTNPREPQPGGALCVPPEYMSDGAKEAWNYAVANAPPGLLSALDGAVLERWANCSGLYREALSKINRAGVSGMIIKTPSGILRRSPLMDVIRDLALEMKSYEAEMGFTPASRSRIAIPADSPTESDPWSEIAGVMATRNYTAIARQYARDVVAGKVPACKWVRAACQRQLDDLAKFKGKDSPYRFNPTLTDKLGKSFAPADNLCAFVERLPHVKGPLAGTPIHLEPWQVFVLTTLYGWVKPDGKRRFRRAYVEVPRGNGKSAISSALALYMLAADGEGGAEVYSLATTRDQARIVFGDAQTMARQSAGFRSRFGVGVGAHNLHVMASGSKFEALSAEGSTLDGLNIHFGCIDELHAHKTRTVYDVVETGTGKRDNSLLWVITTAGSNRSGICYEIRTFVTRLLDRVLDDDSQFGIIYGLDDADDWTLESSLIKANPNWGISVRPEVLAPLQAKAMQMPSAVNNFKTKHLNEWVNADTAWMDMRAWDRCADTALDIEAYAGQPCWIGLDLASKTDIAALLLVFSHHEIDGGFAVFGRYYLPEDTVLSNGNSQYAGWMNRGRLTVTPGNVIDFGWIEADLIDFASRFAVQAVAFDPFQATQLSTRMMSEGLPMIEVRPTVLNFSEPMKTLEALVLQEKLIHDGDPVLGWMASNVVAHLDAKDNIYPRKERPENKIDGIVALIMGISRAITPGTSVILGADYELVML